MSPSIVIRRLPSGPPDPRTRSESWLILSFRKHVNNKRGHSKAPDNPTRTLRKRWDTTSTKNGSPWLDLSRLSSMTDTRNMFLHLLKKKHQERMFSRRKVGTHPGTPRS